MTLKQVADGIVRDLRSKESQPEGSVLPEARQGEATRDVPVRVFGAVTEGGQKSPVPPTLPIPGSNSDDSSLTFSDLLKKIAGEIAPEEFQDGAVEGMTNLEVLARRVFAAALASNMGAQRARELVVDRLEGKAQRAAQVHTPDTTIEDQLDKAAVALLNGMATPDKGA